MFIRPCATRGGAGARRSGLEGSEGRPLHLSLSLLSSILCPFVLYYIITYFIILYHVYIYIYIYTCICIHMIYSVPTSPSQASRLCALMPRGGSYWTTSWPSTDLCLALHAPSGKTSLSFATRFLVSLVKALQYSPRVLYSLIIDPMRSSSFFHWCPWIRTQVHVVSVHAHDIGAWDALPSMKMCSSRHEMDRWTAGFMHCLIANLQLAGYLARLRYTDRQRKATNHILYAYGHTLHLSHPH